MMNINKLSALNSFNNTAKLNEVLTKNIIKQQNFASFMNQFSHMPLETLSAMASSGTITEHIKSLRESLKKSEKVGEKAAKGKANLLDLVTAISESEIVLQNTISIRDKALNAYQEIMRMNM